ncbi:acyl-CoA dehydrogenase family protein [Pseudonocardia pini]|uniref:acyl-CoA dehydrogenase family protein n=1 Tax=Pseudonocardia pini TaxID=2758030 RepID=UPI0015F0EE20|nr:acyl-CoA dehydrogenase family protein [Pseudonocardia pini]
MDLAFSPEDERFREQARDWLATNVPRDPRPQEGPEMREFDSAWQRRQFDGGWAGVSWPTEHGGLGLSTVRQLIWHEEYARAGAPYIGSLFSAVNYGGPALTIEGTPEQQAAHLPRILRGEEVWSQGFSEPEAGSDLAGLRTRGVVDGDELVVTGQKIWSSYAQIADFHFCLVRTDPERPRHKGLTWVLIDLRSPGITVRPIKTMARDLHFCEVFYDEARVPLGNVVGGLHNGWKVAMSTLTLERGTAFMADQVSFERTVDALVVEAASRPGPRGTGRALDDAGVARQLADLKTVAGALRSLSYRSISTLERTGAPGPEGSMMRLYLGEANQRLGRAAMDVLGVEGLAFVAHWRKGWSGHWLRHFASTIGAGTAEIQRNVVGERVLGLPR